LVQIAESLGLIEAIPFISINKSSLCEASLHSQSTEEAEPFGQSVSEMDVNSLEVFKGTVEVMLEDGILTREEKRLVIKLATLLDLEPDEPARVYEAVRDEKEVEGGRTIGRIKQLKVYQNLYEVALVNESLSRDEWRVIRHMKEQFNISDEEDKKVLESIKRSVQEKFEEGMVDKMLHALKDSVTIVGGLFDSVRTKKVND
jgi:uncharacterized tellurite resistance protein B-like protein